MTKKLNKARITGIIMILMTVTLVMMGTDLLLNQNHFIHAALMYFLGLIITMTREEDKETSISISEMKKYVLGILLWITIIITSMGTSLVINNTYLAEGLSLLIAGLIISIVREHAK